jgi:signal transduction histidine kinase
MRNLEIFFPGTKYPDPDHFLKNHFYVNYPLLILLLLFPYFLPAQKADTIQIKAFYDRGMDLNEQKMDSVLHFANLISSRSKEIGYIKGDVLSLRLKGYYEELNNNYEKAIDYYLQSLEAARAIHGTEYEIAALSDLSIVYSNLKRPDKAKEMYLEAARLTAVRGNTAQLITLFTNLGAIYNQLGQEDSAMFFLNEGLRISRSISHTTDLSSLYNNIGNVYFKTRDYRNALEFFRKNQAYHVKTNASAELWLDFLNLADVFLQMKMYDSCRWYADSALKIALKVRSKSKERDSYDLLSRIHSTMGDYKQAYLHQQKAYAIDTALVNTEINHSIVTLQEKYNAREREHQNQLLSVAYEKQRLRSKAVTYLAIAAAIIAVVVAAFLAQKRRVNRKLLEVNDLITRQNDKLAQLNFEKNSLISIVSHDLSSPFASIKMWGHVLQSEQDNLNEEQKKAINRIITSTNNGERLIRTILDVEKAETNKRSLQLENIDLTELVENIVTDVMPSAHKKHIRLHYESLRNPLYLITDPQLIHRICENLLSNALKFTPEGKNVWVCVSEEEENVYLRFKDEGVGISPDEMPNLFSKYAKITSRPTSGEATTGLGLSIVKRLVEELNGEISCESAPDEGSLFTVLLKK